VSGLSPIIAETSALSQRSVKTVNPSAFNHSAVDERSLERVADFPNAVSGHVQISRIPCGNVAGPISFEIAESASSITPAPTANDQVVHILQAA
jgi:hypothetical protein